MARRPSAVPTQRVLTHGIADGATRDAINELSRRLADQHGFAQTEIAALKKHNAALQASVDRHADELKGVSNRLNWATRIAVSAQPSSSLTTSPIGSGGPTPVPTSPPGNTDNGDGQNGFNNAFPSGTAPPGSPITPYVAGQIVGGVKNQFFANYFAGTAGSQDILDTWRLCFNERVIFHLNAAGFQTSHYPGSGNGFKYIILINIPSGGTDMQYAYKITNYDSEDPGSPTLNLTAEMTFVALTPDASTTPDPGIPDATPCP